MRHISVKHCWLLGVVLTLMGTAPAFTQDQFELPKPGPEHKELERLVGTWDATISSGDFPPMKGTMVYKLDYNGFWLIGDFSGEFGGMKFTGRDTSGYDPIQGKYVNTWIDSMSQTMMTSTGNFDDGKLVMTGEGPSEDGQSMAKYKTVSEWKGKDKLIMTMWIVDADGNDREMMTIEYDRKKE